MASISDLLPALVPDAAWSPVGDEPVLSGPCDHAWTYELQYTGEDEARRRCHLCHRHDFAPWAAVVGRLLQPA